MITLMIVEDESIVRRGLVDTIEWESLGFLVVGEAGNGELAVEIFKETNPDVVMTDIKLPGISGLELLKRISEINPDTEFVILSGYDDFKYAQTAINLNVFSYILKLNLFNEIEKVFLSLKEKMMMKIKQKTEVFSIKNNDKAITLINGEAEKKEKPSDMYYCVLIVFSPNKDQGMHRCTELLTRMKLLFTTKGEKSIVVICETDATNANPAYSVNGLVERIKGVIGKKDINNYIIAVGSEKHDMGQIPDSYVEAAKLVDYAIIKKLRGTFDYNNIESSLEAYRICLDWVEIEKYIMLGQKKEMIDLLNNIFDKSVLSKFSVISGMRDICSNVLFKINAYIEKHGASLNSEKKTNSFTHELYKIDYIHELKESYIKEIDRLFTVIYSMNEDSNYEFYDRIKEFVDNNYNKDIKMQDVANYFSVSVPYFSMKFKDYMGMNYSDYLKTRRMEVACALLRGTKMKIIDIAQKVGYMDEKYFHKVFKSVYHCTPIEYRCSK